MSKRLLTEVAGLADIQRVLAQGKASTWMPAASWVPVTTNGALALEYEELTAGQPGRIGLRFDTTTSESVESNIVLPKGWNENSTLTFKHYWTATGGTGDVQFDLSAVALADSDALQTAMGTAVGVADTFITANDVHISSESAAVTVAGSPTPEEYISLRIARNVASDDLTTDGILLGVMLYFTINKPNDK